MSVLFVNDTPDHHEGNAHHYDAPRHVVQVSYVADDGRSWRATFYPDGRKDPHVDPLPDPN